MYEWWVFIHIVGVLVFVGAHGVSMAVLFRLRKERDPRTVSDLLQLSAASIRGLYVGLLLLLVGGVTAGFQGHWWGRAWLWVSIATLLLTTVVMYAMARPFYQRVGLVARAMAAGSEAVTPQQFDSVLRSSQPTTIAVIGFAGLFLILAMMVFKPAFGQSGGTPVASSCTGPAEVELTISAGPLSFDKDCLAALADTPFTIAFTNQASGIPHNVAIYTDASASTALFQGEQFAGTKTVTYSVDPLPTGTYFFQCDVHPAQMRGAFVVEASGSAPSPSENPTTSST